ncbi:MAG: D-alanyl-D-alanine carboxypeptidase, partial [bacterium]
MTARTLRRNPSRRAASLSSTLAVAFAVAFGIALAASFIAPPAYADASARTLPKPLAQALARHRIPASAVSLEVRAMESSSSALLRVNAETPRNPASAIKLLTTLAALELLGPNHRWRTRYLADGAVVDG